GCTRTTRRTRRPRAAGRRTGTRARLGPRPGCSHEYAPAVAREALIGLGLAALGRPGYINLGHGADIADRSRSAMESAAHRVLDAAYDGGVRHFDAARSYGAAEAFLGSWLRARALTRDEVVVSSKWGYAYTAGWRVDAEHHEIKEL